MGAYFAEFRIVGEVADFKYVQSPYPRLLIDVSIEETNRPDSALRPYPLRIATEIRNDFLAGRFLKDVCVGDAIELSGTFTQSGYAPHDLAYVDTVFSVTAFLTQDAKLEQTAAALSTPRTHAIH